MYVSMYLSVRMYLYLHDINNIYINNSDTASLQLLMFASPLAPWGEAQSAVVNAALPAYGGSVHTRQCLRIGE